MTTTLSRAARWDQLKVHIQDVARGYCFTFHAKRTGQLRVLRVRASKARAAYVAAPGIQHALDDLRHTAPAILKHRQQQAATDALRAGVLLHEYGDQSTYYIFLFFFFFGCESYSLHIHGHATKETTSVKRKAIHSRSCKLPSLLG